MYDLLMFKHGNELNEWWKTEIGFSLDKLTQSEALQLYQASSIDEIRNWVAQGELELKFGGSRSSYKG